MTFLETIKIKNGEIYNLPLHLRRMQQTARHFFGTVPGLRAEDIIIPTEVSEQLAKCRIIYDSAIREISVLPYTFRTIQSLRIVEDNDIEYLYKSTDRDRLNRLYARKGDCDDILITKNGRITDTSFTNLVFENSRGLFTPVSYLLNGTKRQLLLEQKIIRETEITFSDLPKYDRVYLINAMIELEDCISIPVSNLRL